MMRWIVKLFPVLLFILPGSCNQVKITTESLLLEMINRDNLTYFPEPPYNLIQNSSYNRVSVSPEKDGWFANADMSHFIRVETNEGRREFVMMDVNGAGAIVRWWMTFYKAQNGTIRIYLDNSSTPVIEGSPDDLLSGILIEGPPFAVSLQEGAPIGEEGRDYDHNFYFPVPFSTHCKVTYECDSLRKLYDYEGTPVPAGYYWPDVFYNICYRLYPEGTQVESFSMEKLNELKPLIEKAGEDLINNEIITQDEKAFEKTLLPGDSLVFNGEYDGMAIARLKVELNAVRKEQALRSTVIKASFDGKQTLWAPVGDFFGSGYTLNDHQTWMNKSDNSGNMECFWIMPFREDFSFALINYGNDTVSLKVMAGFSGYEWNDRSMYFGASWHEHYRIKSRDSTGSPFDLSFAGIEGKGLYVGDQVTLFNNTYHWWGEGDEKIFVDGESFPSSFGTGSEDYYGYSFARQEAFSHPFLSQPVGTGNMSWGPTVNMRHRSLDAIPFTSSIESNIELWHWANIEMNYALTAYYYVFQPFTNTVIPHIESVRKPVSV
jgi:hypothetical protein